MQAQPRSRRQARRPEPSGAGREQKSLLDLLKARNHSLRNVVVRQSQDPTGLLPVNKASWDDRIRYFGCEIAPLLMSLLSASRCAGLAWAERWRRRSPAWGACVSRRPNRPQGPLSASPRWAAWSAS